MKSRKKFVSLEGFYNQSHLHEATKEEDKEDGKEIIRKPFKPIPETTKEDRKELIRKPFKEVKKQNDSKEA